jgi:hypothetical protein
MTNIDMDAVTRLYAHYHQTILSKPSLYNSGPQSITVVLPKALLEFSNAAAGHSGFGAGARPVGIRKSVRDSNTALAELFQSPDSLREFILSSECDGPAHVEIIRQRHMADTTKIKVDPKTSEVFWKKYGKDMMQSLITQFGRSTVEQAYKTLTINEFEVKFNIEELLPAA